MRCSTTARFAVSALGCLLILSCATTLKDIRKYREQGDVEKLIALLKSEDWGFEAAHALGEIGKPAVEPLIAALRDKDSLVRMRAASALGEIKDPRAVEPLTVVALKDEYFYPRSYAAKALRKIGRPSRPLITALRDKDSVVRERAADALREIKDPRAVVPLIAALRDKDSVVRERAADALGEIKDPRAVVPLIAALRDKDSVVRRLAARALGKIGDKSAVPPLIEALHNPNYQMRADAAAALGMLGKQTGDLDLLDTIIPALIDCLTDEYSEYRIDELREQGAWVYRGKEIYAAYARNVYPVRDAALSSLTEITGERFVTDPTEWQKWWERNKGKAESRR